MSEKLKITKPTRLEKKADRIADRSIKEIINGLLSDEGQEGTVVVPVPWRGEQGKLVGLVGEAIQTKLGEHALSGVVSLDADESARLTNLEEEINVRMADINIPRSFLVYHRVPPQEQIAPQEQR